MNNLVAELLKKYPPLLTQKHIEEITGKSASTIEQARHKGGFIPFIRVGRHVRYRLDDVAAYLENLPRFDSTTEADHHRKRA